MEAKDLRNIISRHYGIEPQTIKRLQGYETGTFLIRTEDDQKVLKSYPSSENLSNWLSEESRVLKSLFQKEQGVFPEIFESSEGRTEVIENGVIYRLLSFISGDHLAETPQTVDLIRDFGAFLGKLSGYMHPLEPGTIASKESAWDLQHLLKNRPLLSAVRDPRDRALIDYFFLQFENEVLPHRYSLRRAIIHNDVNDLNALCEEGRMAGLIDFGDMCYSWQVNELAVGLTYVMMNKAQPLEAAYTCIQTYHKEFPLQTEETDILYYLVAGRLCLSLCQSAQAVRIGGASQSREHLEYVTFSEAPARELLHRWAQINPRKAQEVFRSAIGAATSDSGLRADLLEKRKHFFSPALSLSYDSPIVMERAAMQYMYEADGSTYLDAYNNIMLVGHSHPKVVRAASKAMGRLNTNTRYLYDALTSYAERLLALFPKPLTKVFLVNSGSAATDLALRLARAHTGMQKVLVLEHGYHGNTSASISVSHYKHRMGDNYPNTIVGPFPGNPQWNMREGDEDIQEMIRSYLTIIEEQAGRLAGFIAEPIMGCGGQLPLPQGFLKEVYAAIRRQGGLCISDEVQVGFGRLGNWTWGFEMHEVTPDIVILGKPMGNGHPIGGVITTQAVADSFAKGPEFFSSFGGNPVSCAVGNAVLEVLQEEGLQEHAKRTGAELLRHLNNLKKLHPMISEVRGAGLFVGIALANADGSPNPALAHALCNTLKERHILTSTDGPKNNVLKIKPPLPFNTANVMQLCNEIDVILKKTNWR